MAKVDLLFLGTGTSAGVPMIGCDCAVCGSTDPRDQRSRPSVVISHGECRVLVDTSPELRVQCVARGVNRIEAVVFTHAHADHIMGLDDVRRFNTIKGGALDVFADHRTFETLTRCFGYCFRAPDPAAHVYRPHLKWRDVTGPFDIGPMTWRPIPLLHGEMPILGFRVGDLAYCTDVSRIPEESFELLAGVEVLVLDGLQRKPHPTHFSVDQAIATARRIGARQTYLTHIAHSLPHAATCADLPDGVTLAYDGLRVEVGE